MKQHNIDSYFTDHPFMQDNTNPTHYKSSIQPIDFIDANQLDFYEGNIVKYVTRWKHKNGLEDLKKAQWYLQRLVNNVERQRTETKTNQEQA
jgi:methyl coenzyme M reductase subunit C-like uncharacterized protein (methanogenesis marker protein 7)